jgi:flagellar FliL protein
MFRNKVFNIALILIVTIALLGIVGVVAYKTMLAPADGEVKPPSSKEMLESQVDLGKMTTNLAGNGLIQANFSIQGDSKEAKKELDERKLQVKDIINAVLHNTTTADISKADGLAKLKMRLVDELNKVMTEGKVTNVYISDIVVQ